MSALAWILQCPVVGSVRQAANKGRRMIRSLFFSLLSTTLAMLLSAQSGLGAEGPRPPRPGGPHSHAEEQHIIPTREACQRLGGISSSQLGYLRNKLRLSPKVGKGGAKYYSQHQLAQLAEWQAGQAARTTQQRAELKQTMTRIFNSGRRRQRVPADSETEGGLPKGEQDGPALDDRLDEGGDDDEAEADIVNSAGTSTGIAPARPLNLRAIDRRMENEVFTNLTAAVFTKLTAAVLGLKPEDDDLFALEAAQHRSFERKEEQRRR